MFFGAALNGFFGGAEAFFYGGDGFLMMGWRLSFERDEGVKNEKKQKNQAISRL